MQNKLISSYRKTPNLFPFQEFDDSVLNMEGGVEYHWRWYITFIKRCWKGQKKYENNTEIGQQYTSVVVKVFKW